MDGMEIEYDETCYHAGQVWRVVLPKEFQVPPDLMCSAKRVTIEDLAPPKIADYSIPCPNADRLYFLRQN